MKKWYFISPLLLQKLIWVPTRLILEIFGYIKISGMENLKHVKSNVIFICNHTSEFDVFMIPGSLGFFSRFSPIFYTSLENKYYVNAGWRKPFYGGAFFKAWGAYPVRRGLNNYEQSLAHQVRVIRDGGNLCFYPEGKITPDGKIQPGKGGVAYLAAVTGVPVVPVYESGAYKLSPMSLFLGECKLTITFGKPIYLKPPVDRPVSFEWCKAEVRKLMEKLVELERATR